MKSLSSWLMPRVVTKKISCVVVAKGCLDLYFLWVLYDLLSDGSDSWERYTVVWGERVGRGRRKAGKFVRYSLRGQMNTLGNLEIGGNNAG